MARKKRQVVIPEVATIKCPHCSKNFRVKLNENNFLGNFECKKCKQIIQTPPAHCCIVCAFSKKKCPQSLIIEAKMKNLEIKHEERKEASSIKENKPIMLIDNKIIKNSKQQK